MARRMYRLEKLVEGNWWFEGDYSEGEFVKNLAHCAFKLGRNGSVVEDIRVIVHEEGDEYSVRKGIL